MSINLGDIHTLADRIYNMPPIDYMDIINPALVEPERTDKAGNGRRLSRNAKRARLANRKERIEDNRLFKMLRGER